MLYGCSPIVNKSVPILPVMSLKSKIISIQTIKKDDTVGYGCDYIATDKMSVGIVACGYGDGYPRNVSTATQVLIGKHKVPIIGRISMDLMAVDVTHVSAEDLNQDVTMWGDGLPIEIVAKAADTISYDLLTRVNSRVPVIVKNS